MSTVLVVGNGFDLNIGLRTSYNEFFQSCFFHTNKEDTKAIELILSHPDLADTSKYVLSVFNYLNAYKNLTNWCDIEGALGNLLNYYDVETDKGFVISEESFQLLHASFCEHLDTVLAHDFNFMEQKSVAYKLAQELVGTPNLSVINFNYTPTLKRINSFYQDKIQYVHGSFEDRSIIFGVEDDLKVPKEYAFLLKTFSPHYRSHNIRYQLLNAEHIIIFGHSLAKADYHYFKDLFVRQTNPETALQRQKISIFTKNEQSKRDVLWQIRIMNKNRSDYLFDLCQFEIFRTDNDQDRIEKFFQQLSTSKIAMRQVYSMG